MRTLEEQLGALGRHLDAEAPPITTAEILSRSETVPGEAGAATLTVVESDEPVEQYPTEPTMEIIMLAPDHNESPTRTRTIVMVAAIAALALIGALIVGTSGEEDPVPADEPVPTVPAVEPGRDADAASAEPLMFTGQNVDPGRYTTPLLGVPVTLTVDEEWSVAEAQASSIALRNPAGESETDAAAVRWIFLTRLGGWNTRTQAIDPSFRGTGSIEPEEIERWLDQNDVVVLDRRDSLVDGRAAVVVDLQVDPAGASAPLDFARDPFNRYNETCGPATEPCIWYRSIPAVSDPGRGPRPDPVMHTDQTRRMWLIPIRGFEPILIEAVVPVGDEAWLDDFETTTITSLDLGDDAPPLSAG